VLSLLEKPTFARVSACTCNLQWWQLALQNLVCRFLGESHFLILGVSHFLMCCCMLS
jgi:hypothetical protein